ncbi:hypothetical protein HOY82DRAFT_537667 [Tuber indicum]|nr:hypothetical protein HOY82DRAFT_537667 [Tuber indicum]
MFATKIAFLILALNRLVLSIPPPEPNWDTPEAIAALAIINDPTPKPVDFSFMPELAPHNVTAQTSYICDTTAGSPRIDDVRELATNLRDRYGDALCRQENRFGSRCTQLLAYQEAAESMCGEVMRWVYCRTAAWAGFWIADHCEWQGYVGGRLFFDDSPPSRIAVHKRF